MLDSTLYLRNQLLRDSDWTSMAHSVELRTPLVDAFLLGSLDTIQTRFADGAGKRLLAKAPLDALPDRIVNRPKTGFAIPMSQWLSERARRRVANRSKQSLSPSGPWTRQWAAVVIDSFLGGENAELLSSMQSND